MYWCKAFSLSWRAWMFKGFICVLFVSLFCVHVHTCISIAVSYSCVSCSVSPLLEPHLLLFLTISMLKYCSLCYKHWHQNLQPAVFSRGLHLSACCRQIISTLKVTIVLQALKFRFPGNWNNLKHMEKSSNGLSGVDMPFDNVLGFLHDTDFSSLKAVD